MVITGVHAATCTSAAGANNWNTAGTWNCGHVPANGDDVVIAATSTTTLNANSNTLLSLTVNGTLIIASNLNVNSNAAAPLTINSGGTVTIGNNGTARAMVVTGDITVAGTFSVGATAATHTLTAGGNITNTGTVNFAPSGTRVCNVTFNENGNQTVSGAGAYTFNLITLNMGATRNNILDMQSAMTAPSPFLTITNGTYKHSNTTNITPWTADPAIPANGGFWLNSSATVTTTGFNLTLNGGMLRISNGAMNIGTADSIVLSLGNNAATLFQMDGGALKVTGGINSSSTTGTGTVTISGGTITLQTVDAGPDYTFLLGTATTLNWSGGTVIAVNGDNTTDDVDIRSGTQNITGGTLQIGSAATTSTNDISYINGAGGVLNVWNLVLASGPARNILLRSSLNILNDLTINALNNLNPNAGLAINIGGGNTSGNWTNNGTFTQGTTTVTFTGTSATPAIGGTAATTFNNLVINKASNNVTVNTTPTVNATLTLTKGNIVTGANAIIVATTGTIAGPSAASYVVGNFQKNYTAGANLSYFAGNDFPVGDASNYTPVNISAGTTTSAGSLTVSTTATEHPDVTAPIPSTGIDANKDIARYWTFNNSGLTVGTAISATFTFVAGDVDAGANTANFIVERYDGTNWNPTTLVAANPLNTQVSNITSLITGNNDFAIGDPLSLVTPVPGAYNAFDPVATTANGPILGKIQTKIAGTGFSVEVVHVNATKSAVLAGAITVEVRLLDSSSGGAVDVNGCNAGWPLIQAAPNFAIPASGWGTIPAVTVANSYPSVRFQIRSPVGGPYTQIGCSTDLFAIRPASFTISPTDADWQTAGTARALNNIGATAGVVHKAGQPFTLKATAINGAAITTTNYVGTPMGVTCVGTGTPGVNVCNAGGVLLPAGTSACTGTACIGTPGVVTPGAAAAGVINLTTTYSDAGAFTLQLQDETFANVDAVDGTPADCTATGRYVCGTQNVGRFVPDHFDVSTAVAPQFQTFGSACATRSFTYIGQPFGYATAYQATVTARNSSGATTANYKGGLWKVAGSDITQTYSNNAVGPALDTTLVGTPTVADNLNGTATVTPQTLPTAARLAYQRSTATPVPAVNNPFSANISLTVSAQDASENGANQGIITSSTSALFNGTGTGIAFDGGTFTPVSITGGQAFVYGVLRLSNSIGSELLDLPIPIQTQYWTSTGFVLNSDDLCTSIASVNISLDPTTYQGTLNAANMGASHIGPGVILSGGKGNLTLTKPSPTASGSVDVTVDLAGAGMTYLQGNWTTTTFTQNPTARANFGIYGKQPNQFLYFRENH